MICLNSDGIFCLNKEKILNPYIKGFKNEHVLVYYFFFIITLARIINVSFPVDGHDVISPILGSSSPQTFFVFSGRGSALLFCVFASCTYTPFRGIYLWCIRHFPDRSHIEEYMLRCNRWKGECSRNYTFFATLSFTSHWLAPSFNSPLIWSV